MARHAWLIPALPLAGFLILVAFGPRLRTAAGWLATSMMGGAFAATVAVFADLVSRPAEERQVVRSLFTWIPAGGFRVDMGFLADPLSITMCLFITGVGALIHLYAIGYMKGDPKFSKFFLYLNLFAASMLVLVLGSNLLVTFLGWEGVGACSYLLISFWHSDPANASAGKKAFVTNRVGDWGFMLGTFLTWMTVGSLDYLQVNAAAGTIAAGTATAITLLFFVGATGKSAQLPLYVWLPDAMAGPTPVSALIHAATMVTSGVYLLVRLNPVLAHAGWANDVVAWVGIITALVAATIAVAQNDIKKVLAYSTVSQLGYMFLAVGTGNYVGGIFHMVTHAFFKALMFLGSGSVILSMSHEQDMRRYGNLRRYLPITAGTFIIGWLAIAGVPPFSGFWSKDEILAGAWQKSPVLWALGLVTALLTAFYMTRLVMMTFFGSEKWRTEAGADHESVDHAVSGPDVAHVTDGGHGHGLTPDHEPVESPWTMTLPLVVLAGLSLVGGVLNLPFAHSVEFLGGWLEPTLAHEHALPGGSTLVVLAVIATLGAVVGILGGVAVYLRNRVDRHRIELPILAHGWHIDDTYAKVAGGPGRAAFEGLTTFDSEVIDGGVNGLAGGVSAGGRLLSRLQNGKVRSYALGIAAGAVLILAYAVMRMSV